MKPDLAIEIVSQLRLRGHQAYLVGGCVRDMVMQIEPSDYDIATSATPAEIMKIFPHTEAIGVQFGVVLVVHRGHPFEVATFRSDEAYVDGRRPTGVVFTDAQTDVLRRDFTINGLLYDPVDKHVIDHVSGQDDIRDRIIRAIGDPVKRFTEDKLRLLRAVRFAARFKYTIEPATWDAVCRMASSIRQVSAERISIELQRILTEGQAGQGLRLLKDSGLLSEVLPEVEWNEHLQASVELIAEGTNPDLALAILLHAVPSRALQEILERLKLSKSGMQHTLSLVRSLPQFGAVRTMQVSALKRFLRVSKFGDHMELARICAVAAGKSLEDYNFVARMRSEWSSTDIAPDLLISGEDLIVMGFSPGPRFKEILTRVEDEQLEGKLADRQQALDFVSANFSVRS